MIYLRKRCKSEFEVPMHSSSWNDGLVFVCISSCINRLWDSFDDDIKHDVEDS